MPRTLTVNGRLKMRTEPQSGRSAMLAFCIECLSPIVLSPKLRTVKCIRCRAVISRRDLDAAIEFARNIVLYGYLYPRVLARDKAAEVRKRYALVPDPILVWLGLAAVGGIIGDLSYDLVKVGIKKILGRKTKVPIISRGQTDLSTKAIMLGEQKVMTLVFSQSEIEAFIRALRKEIDRSQDKRRRQAEKRKLVDRIIKMMEQTEDGQEILHKLGRKKVRKEVVELAGDPHPPRLPRKALARIGRKLEDDQC